MARMCKTAFAQLSVMLSSEAGKTRIFFSAKKQFWLHPLNSVISTAEDEDEFVPISSGCLLLEEGELGSDCCLLASS